MKQPTQLQYLAVCVLASICVRGVLAADYSTSPSGGAGAKGGMFSAQPVAERVRLGIEGWDTMAAAEWEISFKFFDPDLGFGSGRSVLEWEDIDSLVTVVYGEVTVTPWLRLSGRFGWGEIDDGQNTDSDYITAHLVGFDDFQFMESEAATEGETRMFDTSVHFVLSSLAFFEDFKGELDLFLGYQYYTDELNDKNGVVTVDFGEPAHTPFPAELDSTFDFEWQSVRWGIRGSYPVLAMLHIDASLALLPAVDYQGEGFWNLRSDLKSSSPNFVQEADGGAGMDGTVAVTFLPLEHVGIRLGYRYNHWEVEDGEDETYFASGATETATVDSAQATRHGFFLGVFGRF